MKIMMRGTTETFRCDYCGREVYVDTTAPLLPYPVRDWDTDDRHSCSGRLHSDGSDDD